MVRQMRLTEISIKALKTPRRGAAVFYDDGLTGFGVRVSEGGTKSYILTHGRRRQRETIGRVGVLALHEARAEAKRRLAEYRLRTQSLLPLDSAIEMPAALADQANYEPRCGVITNF